MHNGAAAATDAVTLTLFFLHETARKPSVCNEQLELCDLWVSGPADQCLLGVWLCPETGQPRRGGTGGNLRSSHLLTHAAESSASGNKGHPRLQCSAWRKWLPGCGPLGRMWGRERREACRFDGEASTPLLEWSTGTHGGQARTRWCKLFYVMQLVPLARQWCAASHSIKAQTVPCYTIPVLM